MRIYLVKDGLWPIDYRFVSSVHHREIILTMECDTVCGHCHLSETFGLQQLQKKKNRATDKPLIRSIRQICEHSFSPSRTLSECCLPTSLNFFIITVLNAHKSP